MGLGQNTEMVGELTVVTRKELLELQNAEQVYADASKALTAAQNKVQTLRQMLAEKVLGVKNSDELKRLEPEQVAKLQEKRLKQGDYEVLRGAPQFEFVKSSVGRYPSWRQEFIALEGEAAANKITLATPPTYSYRVEVGA